MFICNFNNNSNNTIRQNIERIMREKGLLPEQQVLHTEIGDFHYYPENNAAADNYNQPLPEYNATVAHNYQLRPQPNQQTATTATPQDFGMANSATATAMHNYAPNAFAAYNVPTSFGQAPQRTVYQSLTGFTPDNQRWYENNPQKDSFNYIQDEAERDVIKYNEGLKSQVIKIPDHGAARSSYKPFFKMVAPSHGIISVGKDNQFGYPSDQALELFDDLGIKIYRTDINGNIRLTVGGKDEKDYYFSVDR